MKNMFFNIIKLKLSFLAKLFTKKNNENKIGIISFKFIGDTVFTIPSIKIICEKFPGNKISLFCYDESKPIYQLVLKNIEYVTFPKAKLNFISRKPNWDLINMIRKNNFSTLFDLTSEYQTALAVLLSGSKQRIGFNTKYFEGVYNTFSEKKTLPDLIDMHLDPVKKYFGLEDKVINKNFKKDYNKSGKIIIHPFAGWKAKEWSLTNFIALAEELNRDYETEILIQKNFLSPSIIEEINNKNITIKETGTVEELIAGIKECSVLISNDSGPVYIAALLGKATFTIYGPTNPRYSLPAGDRHAFVRESIACSPEEDKQYCFTYGGRFCNTFDCMVNLSYEKVKKEVIFFLEKVEIVKVKLAGTKTELTKSIKNNAV